MILKLRKNVESPFLSYLRIALSPPSRIHLSDLEYKLLDLTYQQKFFNTKAFAQTLNSKVQLVNNYKKKLKDKGLIVKSGLRYVLLDSINPKNLPLTSQTLEIYLKFDETN